MQQFSELIGVTHQQIYKYERGINTISAGQLFAIARGTGTPIEYFFEGLETNERESSRGQDVLIDLMRSLHVMGTKSSWRRLANWSALSWVYELAAIPEPAPETSSRRVPELL